MLEVLVPSIQTFLLNHHAEIELTCGGIVLLSMVIVVREQRFKFWRDILKTPANHWIQGEDRKKSPWWLSGLLKNFPALKYAREGLSLQEAMDETLTPRETPVLGRVMFDFFSKLHSKLSGEKGPADFAPISTSDSGTIIRPTADALEEQKIKNIVALPGFHENPALPVEAVASSAIVHFFKAIRGKKTYKKALEHAVLDAVGASGGFAGAKLAAMAVIAIIPILSGSATFWVPIVMILGAAVGGFTGRTVAHRIKERKFYATRKALQTIASEFKRELLLRIPEMQLELERDFDERLKGLTQLRRSKFRRTIRFFYPDLLTTWSIQAKRRVLSDKKSSRKSWTLLRSRISRLRFDDLHRLIFFLNEKSVASYPRLFELLHAYKNAITPDDESNAFISG